MEQAIIKLIESKNNNYVNIINETSIKKIYELLINHIIYVPENIIENHYLGWYYDKIENNYNLMKKYYLFCTDNGCMYSMHKLGYYYRNIEKNYDLMKKYYLMAVDKDYNSSMHNLGYYYQFTEINYDLMKKYYLMAVDRNNISSMYNLGYYYQFTEIDYNLMKKYYLMAIDNNNIEAFDNLIHYYNNSNLINLEKLEFYIKYIDKIRRNRVINVINKMAKLLLSKEDNKKFVDIIVNFEFRDDDKVSSIIRTLIETIKYKISMTRLHFEYSLEGKGFEEAREDFYSKII
jgi:hypothetical protein